MSKSGIGSLRPNELPRRMAAYGPKADSDGTISDACPVQPDEASSAWEQAPDGKWRMPFSRAGEGSSWAIGPPHRGCSCRAKCAVRARGADIRWNNGGSFHRTNSRTCISTTS
jgi:hypothetical protein